MLMKENFQTIKTLLIGMALILALSSAAKAQRGTEGTRLFDSFGGANWEDSMARLDSFAIQLQNEPNATGAIIVYGGQGRRRGEPEAWSNCIRDYLINRRGISANRIVMINGGYRNSLTAETWLTLSTGDKPTVTPSPTIKDKDVRFSKGKIKRWRSLCNI